MVNKINVMVNKIKIEDAYHPLSVEDVIDITIRFNGKFYRGEVWVDKL